MCLIVDANGHGNGAGTHLSMFVHLMRGEHDNKLNWPFQGDITIQLLNQKQEEEHVEKTLYFDDKAIAGGCADRVTSGEYGGGWGYDQFISHTAVVSITAHYGGTEWRTTQYLHNDCLKWRVSNIVVHSV